jgi:hypothetical protein
VQVPSDEKTKCCHLIHRLPVFGLILISGTAGKASFLGALDMFVVSRIRLAGSRT